MRLEDEIRDNLRRIEAQKRARQAEGERAWKLWYREAKKEAERIILPYKVISDRYIVPYLEAVNNVLANGKGEIIGPDTYLDSSRKRFNFNTITLLKWGGYCENGRSAYNEIKFEIDPKNRLIRGKGEVLNVNDLVFDEKMRNLIIKITSDPRNYYFEDRYDIGH